MHTAQKNSCSLTDFIVSSLRFVKFWEYRNSDKVDFEFDLQTGIYVEINGNEAFHKMEFMRGLCSKALKEIPNSLIPIDFQSLTELEMIILINDEWNNRSLVLVSDTEYKIVYFGTSE